MDDGHRGVSSRALVRQQQGQGPAKGRPSADDDDTATGNFDAIVGQHHLDARRGAGHRPRFLEHEAPQVHGVEAVGILGRIDASQGLVEVESVGHRMLDQVGVDLVVAVEGINSIEEGLLASVGDDLHIERLQADLLARLMLAPHIAGARCIVANQDGAQPGSDPLGLHLFDPDRDLVQDLIGDGLTRHQLCHHQRFSPVRHLMPALYLPGT